MNEESPKSEQERRERIRQLDHAAGSELQRQDEKDPVRGPIVRQVSAVFVAAHEKSGETGGVYDDLESFQKSFIKHFGDAEARRHRLFHVVIGSTPLGSDDLFDAEGEWSIAKAMRGLAEKYNIDIDKV